MSQKIGFTYPRGIEIVNAPADAGVRSHIETFQRLIEKVEDNDKLYACMTYGVKPLSQILIMAIQYAYRLSGIWSARLGRRCPQRQRYDCTHPDGRDHPPAGRA